jgi:hypothetical protein
MAADATGNMIGGCLAGSPFHASGLLEFGRYISYVFPSNQKSHRNQGAVSPKNKLKKSQKFSYWVV